MTTTADLFISASRKELNAWREKIPHCLDQLDEDQVWWRPRGDMNSIGNLILHVCGNLTQWILSGVGGEPDLRDRPREFTEPGPIAKAELVAKFDEVAARIDPLLAELTAETLAQSKQIQGFDESKLSAIFHSLAHLHGHGQEIICLTRMQVGTDYRFFLTISD